MGIDLQKMRRSTLAFQNIDFDDVTANSGAARAADELCMSFRKVQIVQVVCPHPSLSLDLQGRGEKRKKTLGSNSLAHSDDIGMGEG